jgi:hypothetical protein
LLTPHCSNYFLSSPTQLNYCLLVLDKNYIYNFQQEMPIVWLMKMDRRRHRLEKLGLPMRRSLQVLIL